MSATTTPGPAAIHALADRRQRKMEYVLLFLLLGLGLAIRIYSAFIFKSHIDTDLGVSAMMAKHIAEGLHFPIIHYNSPYVGTIEVYVAALFHRMLPHSLLPSMLSFGLFSFLALPFFYFFVRGVYGVTAARFALAVMAIGPVEFFYRNVFIGYPTVMLAGMACCFFTYRIIARNDAHAPVFRDAFFLGLFAGIGWWTNSLVVIFLLPCAIILPVSVPPRRWSVLGAGGGAGLLLGAGAWIAYSLQLREALGFVTDVSASRPGMFQSNAALSGRMLFELLGIEWTREDWLRSAASGALLLLVAAGLAQLGRMLRSRARPRGMKMLALLPCLLIASNVVMCGISNRFAHVPAVRYLIPSLPALAMLAGVGAAWVFRRRHRAVAWMAPAGIAVIVLGDAVRLPRYWSSRHQSIAQSRRDAVNDLAAFARQHQVDGFYGSFQHQWMVFASDEQLKITSYPYYFDRYRPHREAVALRTNVAVINNHYGFEQFLAATRAHARRDHKGGVAVWLAIQPPPTYYRYLSPEMIERFTWEDGTPVEGLMDDNLDTPICAFRVQRDNFRGHLRTARLRLKSPRSVRGLHAWGPSGTWTSISRVAGITPDGEEILLYDGLYYGWFWSDRFLFQAGYMSHPKVLFPDIMVDELHISLFTTEEGGGTSMTTELLILTEDDASPVDAASGMGDSSATGTAMISHLRRNPAPMTYTPRWLAEMLRTSDPTMRTVLPGDYYEQYEGVDRYPAHPVLLMDARDGAALVVPRAAGPRSSRLLREQGWIIHEAHDFGGWMVYHVSHAAGEGAAGRLYWTEQGVFLAESLHYEAEPDSDQGMELLTEPIVYPKGIALASLSISTNRLEPGGELMLTYRWRCPPDIHPIRKAVFVHFVHDDATRFQDDHVWLEDVSVQRIMNQPRDWLFTVTRPVLIPDGIPAGQYSIRAGLYDRVTGEKSTPGKSPQVRKKAAVVPEAFEILDAP